MTEEVKTEVKAEEKQEVKQTEVKTEEVKLSVHEQRAVDQGWQPLEEWKAAGHDEAEWRDARSFLDRGELLNRISSQSKEMKELRKALKTFEQHNKELAQAKFQEKLSTLKTAKKDALENGDAARVVELDEQIDLVRDGLAASKAEVVQEAIAPEVPPEFQRWVDRNTWYGQNNEMREFADQVGTAYARSNRDKTPVEVLKYVETRVKKAYPESFSNTARQSPSTVEGGSGVRAGGRAKSDPVSELPPEAVEVMNTLVRGGHMTKEEYIKQYNLKKG
jgi:hypothetical protein